MTLDHLPDLPLVLDPSGTLRLFNPQEDFTTIVGEEYTEITVPSRTFVTRAKPGGELNPQAT